MDKILLNRLKNSKEIQERLKKEGYSFPISWKNVERAIIYNYNEQKIQRQKTVDGYTFEYDAENKFYECRGRVCYDDEHDEIPEEGLWNAAHKLEQKLKTQGIDCEVEHSEKGWVEVQLIN